MLSLIGSLGQAFGPMHLTTSHIARRAALGLIIIVPYVVLAWRGASKSIARPYLIASAVYLLMLFIMLPVRHLRYLLPLSLVIGWSVSGYLALFRRRCAELRASNAWCSSATRAFTTSTISSRSSSLAKALAVRVETQSAND